VIDQVAWSAWDQTSEPNFAFASGEPGEVVQIEATAIDAIGNESAVTGTTVVVTDNSCDAGEAPGEDYTGRSLHEISMPAGQAFDSHTFVNPVSPQQLLDALPPSAHVLHVIERTYTSGGGVQTSGFAPLNSESLAANLATYDRVINDDIDAQYEQMTSYLSQLTGDDRIPYENSLRMLDDRRAIYSRHGGVPIKSVATAPDPAVVAAIQTAFSGNIDFNERIETEVNVECDSAGDLETTSDTSGGSIPTASISTKGIQALGSAILDAAPLASVVPSFPHIRGWKVPSTDLDRNVHSRGYTPKFLRVYIGRRADYGFVTTRWKWNAANTKYWRYTQRRTRPAPGGYAQRGAEIQIQMDVDDDGPFGFPYWQEDDPTRDNVDSGVWSATNMNCPYPDDYSNPNPFTNELRGRYNLTIGEGCRPSKRKALSSWTHILVTNSDENKVDRVKALVSPVHRAKSNHVADVDNAPDKSEYGWCEDNSIARGSCRFTDHLPSSREGYSTESISEFYLDSLLSPGVAGPPGTPGSVTTKVFHRE
jgi:hypothetical protein